MVFILFENALAIEKIESRHFLLVPPQAKVSPQVLIITPMQKEITCPPRQHLYENMFPPAEIGGGNYD